jgi:hypothetical protein
LKRIDDNTNEKADSIDIEDQESTQEAKKFSQHINNTLQKFSDHISMIIRNDQAVRVRNRTVSSMFVDISNDSRRATVCTDVPSHSHNNGAIKTRPEYRTIMHVKRVNIAEEQIGTIIEQLKLIYASGGHATTATAATFVKLSRIQRQQRNTLIEGQASLFCAIQTIRESLLSGPFRMKNSNDNNLDLDEQKKKML